MMRNEDDLRAAFGSLEGQVADRSRILTGVARERRRRTLRRRAGGALAAAGLSVAAVVAIVQVPTAPHSQVAAAAVRVKLLAAWAADGNDILVTHSTYRGDGPSHPIETVDSWSYPWAASPGQREQDRVLYREDGRTQADEGGSYTVPKPGTKIVHAPGIHVDYSTRTWSHVREVREGSDPSHPSELRREIASGEWKVSGPTEFHGHRALKLTETFTDHPAPGQTLQYTTQLWVDASTYLPLYEYITSSGAGAVSPTAVDFELLPPTPANLALLKPVIPPGFRQFVIPGMR